MARKAVKNRWTRPLIQAFFFVLIALTAINHSLVEQGKGIDWFSNASLHGLCPFGGVVSVYRYVSQVLLVQKVHQSSFVLMFIGFALAIAFGPVFCGWVCPLGTFEEWMSKLGRKLFGKRHNQFIPARVDIYLRYLRYAVLIGVVYMTARTGQLLFANIDPYFALFNFWTSEVAVGGLIVLGITIAAALFVERPFCKYSCPYGALIGVFNLFRVFKIRRNAETCIDCKSCDRACPMNIEVSTGKAIRDHQCITCMQCTSEAACPVANTVELLAKGGN